MRLGLLLPKYNTSQFAHEAIDSINKYVPNNSKHDFILFYENLSNFCLQPLCAAMPVDEIAMFNDGILIATDFNGLETIVKTINTSQKILYLADIEWLRRGYKRTYEENMSILDGVRLIARSETHKEILENYCDMDVEVMGKLDIIAIGGICTV